MRGSVDHTRAPCPWRILEDFGGAFCMGLVGSTIFQIWAVRNAPRNQRFRSFISNVKTRSPLTAGGFAAWGGTFAICECTITQWRQQEDAWNSIVSGAVAGGLVVIRKGPATIIASAAFGGLILACIEGVSIAMNNFAAVPFKPVAPVTPPPS